MYLNISSWQTLTECLFCTKNYARCSEKNKHLMIPDLYSQSCRERLNEHEIAKHCNSATWGYVPAGVDNDSYLQTFAEGLRLSWREENWSPGKMGALRAEFNGSGEYKREVQATEGQYHEHSCRDRKENDVSEALIWPNWWNTKEEQDRAGVVRSQFVSFSKAIYWQQESTEM